MSVCSFAGLVVGAVIKYTSSLPKNTTKDTVAALNLSGDWTDPPDYIRLKVAIEHNDTHSVKYYQYAFSSHLGHQEPLEPELEEKANYYHCFLCGV